MERAEYQVNSGSLGLIRLYDPEGLARNSSHWRINGFPARVIVWTREEWERLEHRPPDAQYLDCGVWCVLRMD